MLLLASVALLAAGALAQTPPPVDGDWEVSDLTTYSGTDITVRGNVTVLRDGVLTLSDLDLLIDLPHDGAYGIEVRAGGTLNLDRVTVDSADRSTRFNITILGSATIGGNGAEKSYIRRMDGATAPNPLAAARGLVIRSSSVLIHNTTVEQCGGFAIAVMPAGLSDVAPVLEDCLVRNNAGGLYCGGLVVATGDAVVRNCQFYGNGLSQVLVIAANPTFVGCTFGWYLSPGLIGLSVAALAQPEIIDCTFTALLGSGIISLMADPTVRGGSMLGCGIGVNVLGGSPTIDGVSFSNCFSSMALNSTTATVTDCSIGGFLTAGYAVSIDGGRPSISGLEVDLLAIGGGVSIVNSSRASIADSNISATRSSDCISVIDSTPTISGCLLEGGQDGLDLTWCDGTIEDCTIRDNAGWGIIGRFERPTARNNHFGTGSDENVEGRILYIFQLTVYVEFENGTAANGSTVKATNAIGAEVLEVVTNPDGFAFDETLPEYVLTNENQAIQYSPYRLFARLGDLINRTSVEIGTNPTIILVLRPIPDDPPVVEITSPEDGREYNAWDYPHGIPVCGTAIDPEDGPLEKYWSLWTMGLPPDPAPLELEPGYYELSLGAIDSKGQNSVAFVHFTVVSRPPDDFGVEILSPTNVTPHLISAPILFEVRIDLEEAPYWNITVEPNITWESDLDGEITLDEDNLATLSTSAWHLITVTLRPHYPQWHDVTEYTDTVWVDVRYPFIEAIITPKGPVNVWSGEEVHLSGEDSWLERWEGLEYAALFKWTQPDLGVLGEGPTLNVSFPITAVYIITLEITTVPNVASDNATVRVIVHHGPPPRVRAVIDILTQNLTAGVPINFTASNSTTPMDEPLGSMTVSWDFDDGNTSVGIEVTHTYAEAGTYAVRLTIVDSLGISYSTEAVFDVKAAPDPGNGGNGGNGGDGGDGIDGDVDGPRDPDEELYGWLFLLFLLVILVAMLYLAYRGRRRHP